MIRITPAPTSTKLPATNKWPAAWRGQVDKALGPGVTQLQHEDACRLGSALAEMQKKDAVEIKAPQRKR
jgi:hypothetical protein